MELMISLEFLAGIGAACCFFGLTSEKRSPVRVGAGLGAFALGLIVLVFSKETTYPDWKPVFGVVSTVTGAGILVVWARSTR